MSEYYSAMLKNRIPDPLIQDNVEAMIGAADIRLIGLDTIRSAQAIRSAYRFSYWDSLILATALEAGCSTVYSEDMQHGQVIEKRLTVINPFRVPA